MSNIITSLNQRAAASSVETQPEGKRSRELSPEEISRVEKQFAGSAWFSPYQLAGQLSVLAGRQIRPQMCYNYVRKGWIETQVGPTGKKMVRQEECVRFAMKYLAANS